MRRGLTAGSLRSPLYPTNQVMADVFITAVSASYTGTDNADNIRNSTGNLRSITVAGLGGNDVMNLGSAVNAGTGAGGLGLGFSLGSSNINLGAGDDTYTFSGQAGSGFAFQASTITDMGDGSDFALLNGLASASAATIRGGSGADQLTFAGANGGAASAFDVWINGNAGADSITVTWTGTHVSYFRVEGGADNDSISATFSSIASYSAAASGSNQSGARVQGNKGADLLIVTAAATADELTVNGNTGADTISVVFSNDNSGSNVFGGRDSDVISAVLANGVSAVGLTVAGNIGNDTATLNVNANYLANVSLQGNSGADLLTLSAVGNSTADGVSVVGGTGTDSIVVNIGGNTFITAASGFVINGSEGSGDSVTVNASATLGGSANALIIGNTGNDTILIRAVDGGSVSGAIASGNGGADLIGLVGGTTTAAGGSLIGVDIFGGAGADTLSATFAVSGGYYNATGDGSLLDGGEDADSVQLNLATGSTVTAFSVVGGLGDDSITVNANTGGIATSDGVTAGRAFNLAGNDGNDVFGLIAANGSNIGLQIDAGTGNDLVTATLTNGTIGGLTATLGDGADTLTFTQLGTTVGATGRVYGNDGADSISVLFATTGLIDGTFGLLNGGSGVDTITVGVTTSAGSTFNFSGVIAGGANVDSIQINGLTGNTNPALSGTFFDYASGDSTVANPDSISIAVTAGNGMLSGAGMSFSGYNAVEFTKAGNPGGLTAGRYQAGFSGGFGAGVFLASTGGLVTFSRAGTAGIVNQTAGFIISRGDATTANIVSAVDRWATIGNSVTTFNIQNGSAGAVNGYVFIQGGVNADTLIRLNGLAQTGPAIPADFAFRAGSAGGFRVTDAGGNGTGAITFGAAL